MKEILLNHWVISSLVLFLILAFIIDTIRAFNERDKYKREVKTISEGLKNHQDWFLKFTEDSLNNNYDIILSDLCNCLIDANLRSFLSDLVANNKKNIGFNSHQHWERAISLCSGIPSSKIPSSLSILLIEKFAYWILSNAEKNQHSQFTWYLNQIDLIEENGLVNKDTGEAHREMIIFASTKAKSVEDIYTLVKYAVRSEHNFEILPILYARLNEIKKDFPEIETLSFSRRHGERI